jgi:WD40 repeat protein
VAVLIMRFVLLRHDEHVSLVAFSPDGKQLISGSQDNTTRIWDAQTGTELNVLRGHDDCVTSVAFSPDGLQVVSSSFKTIIIWDAHTGEKLHLLQERFNVDSVTFSPDGTHLVLRDCRKSCNPRSSVNQTMASTDKPDDRLVCAERRKS